MLNKEQHQLIMGQILKDMYSDTSISSLLGFKGGTCAYFFYGLPRFSVDLDFDLMPLQDAKKEFIFEKIEEILNKYGIIRDKFIKKFTIFLMLSYGDADHNIKIEINTRNLFENINNYYEIKEFLGISIKAAKKDFLFSNKLAALTLRKETAMRDVYDIHYFLKNNTDIDQEILLRLTGKTVKEHLSGCIKKIESVKDSQVLRGLGELVDEKEKSCIKKNLKSKTIFLLKNYISVLG